MNQSNWKGALQKPLWEQPYKMLKRTTKPLRRRVLIEEGTAKSSKKQHSENTGKWHLCHVKQVVFRMVNHRQRKSPKMNQSNWKGALQKPLWEEQPYKMLKRTTKPLRRRVLIELEEGTAKSSKKQHLENTDKWHLCKAGSFSYGESLQTPPLEGTSLHRWNNSVERPWGILSLFTTCLQAQSSCHSL